MKKIFFISVLLVISFLVGCKEKEKSIKVGDTVYVITSEKVDDTTTNYELKTCYVKRIEINNGILEYALNNGLFTREFIVSAQNVFTDYEEAVKKLKSYRTQTDSETSIN